MISTAIIVLVVHAVVDVAAIIAVIIAAIIVLAVVAITAVTVEEAWWQINPLLVRLVCMVSKLENI